MSKRLADCRTKKEAVAWVREKERAKRRLLLLSFRGALDEVSKEAEAAASKEHQLMDDVLRYKLNVLRECVAVLIGHIAKETGTELRLNLPSGIMEEAHWRVNEHLESAKIQRVAVSDSVIEFRRPH